MKLDDKLKNVIRPLAPEEFALVAEGLRRYPNVFSRLLVSEDDELLLDGYARLRAMHILGMTPRLERVKIDDPVRFRILVNYQRSHQVQRLGLLAKTQPVSLPETSVPSLSDILDILEEIWQDAIDLSLDKRTLLLLFKLIANGGEIKDIPLTKKATGLSEQHVKERARQLQSLKSVQRWISIFRKE